MVSPGTPLIGEPGTLIHQSPDGRLEIRRAIMSSFPAEAIVNATDKFMIINTANIRGAEHQIIHVAGSELRNHLRYNYHFGLPVGDALATSSFEAQNCWYIIHVNGPDFESRRRYVMPLLKQQLADCYRRCMEEAFRLGVTVRAWLRHRIHGEARRAVIERVTFLADPVGRQAHQEQAWCAAFR
jgi:O-acetyl-ADP-ribose deacetylase